MHCLVAPIEDQDACLRALLRQAPGLTQLQWKPSVSEADDRPLPACLQDYGGGLRRVGLARQGLFDLPPCAWLPGEPASGARPAGPASGAACAACGCIADLTKGGSPRVLPTASPCPLPPTRRCRAAGVEELHLAGNRFRSLPRELSAAAGLQARPPVVQTWRALPCIAACCGAHGSWRTAQRHPASALPRAAPCARRCTCRAASSCGWGRGMWTCCSRCPPCSCW